MCTVWMCRHTCVCVCVCDTPKNIIHPSIYPPHWWKKVLLATFIKWDNPILYRSVVKFSFKIFEMNASTRRIRESKHWNCTFIRLVIIRSNTGLRHHHHHHHLLLLGLSTVRVIMSFPVRSPGLQTYHVHKIIYIYIYLYNLYTVIHRI